MFTAPTCVTVTGGSLLLGLVLAIPVLTPGCSGTAASGEPRVTVIKPSDKAPPMGGVPPDKRAEISLLLQQRDPSVRKCYQDVLNEKNDRAFQGTVKLVITLQPSGQASDVRIIGGTLNNDEVSSCLVETIKNFEFPELAQAGDVEYDFSFRPAY
jgi:hypothetical protein